MSDEAALLAAIIANPDDDTPRLVYADWLDENLPDAAPSPAAGPSARAEYIRVQCRLARLPFDDPDYPELLERERDIAAWLRVHAKKDPSVPRLPKHFEWGGGFDSGPDRAFDRGFPEELEYTDYADEAALNVERILGALPAIFADTTVRSLKMEGAYGEELAELVRSPVVAGLRGLSLTDVLDEDDADGIRAIATSPHLANLKRLRLDTDLGSSDLERLAESARFPALESFSLESLSDAEFRLIGGGGWFRNLRSLRVCVYGRNTFKTVGEFPAMPDLVELAVEGSYPPSASAVRKFATSDSFPRLARLEIRDTRLAPEHAAILARAEWPLRQLTIHGCAIGKAGAEALARAAFAGSLRVLELSDCEITAGGVQSLAGSEKLAGLKHLSLHSNPVGAGGLEALARSRHLRGLRSLTLSSDNHAKATINAATMLNFLTALDVPELRHLELDWLPLGVRGARAIGSGATFANLTRLSLAGCGLGEKGARAIVESDSLRNLVALDLSHNTAGKGVAALADPRTLPRLATANLSRDRIPSWTLARLRKRPGVFV